jgi:hypothetical protein
MSKLTSVLSGLMAVAAFASASAQDLIPVNSIKYAGRYDLATGTFFPSDVDPGQNPSDSGTSEVLYDNSTTNGFLSTGSGAVATNHHMDWGTPTFAGGGASITEVRLAWATNLVAPNVVGLRFRLYAGATGNGNPGTVIADYLLTNLPNSVSGQYEGYLLDVTLPTPLSLSDGAFGWSYNADNPVGALATASGPLLVGPPNAAGAGAAHAPPATGFGSYDRYSEATEAYVGTVVGTSTMLSFVMRLTGRADGGGSGAWVNYGEKNKTTLTGEGSATPGSVDNVITIKNNPPGKSVILVAGITQADFFQPSLGLQFYAFPWLVQLAPIGTNIVDGTVDLPAALDVSLPPGTQLFLQAFGQNLSNQYKNWSAGLQITIQ